MAAVEDTRQRAGQLCDQARSARSRALDLRAQARMLGAAAAANEDRIAATLDQLARQQPHRAGYLRDMGKSARVYAVRERERLMGLHGGGTSRRGQDHAVAARRPTPGSASRTEAAASAMTPDHADDLFIIAERDRIAAQLQDTIIRRVFAAGLSLQSAAALTADREVRWRIEAAVSELDQVLCEIRNVVFQDAQHRDGRGLSQDIADLAATTPPRYLPSASLANPRINGLSTTTRPS